VFIRKRIVKKIHASVDKDKLTFTFSEFSDISGSVSGIKRCQLN